METEKKNEFLAKLKALLSEYNASISLESDPCSDWHGITGEKMVISHRVEGTFKYIELLSVDGSSLGSEDIKD